MLLQDETPGLVVLRRTESVIAEEPGHLFFSGQPACLQTRKFREDRAQKRLLLNKSLPQSKAMVLSGNTQVSAAACYLKRLEMSILNKQ